MSNMMEPQRDIWADAPETLQVHIRKPIHLLNPDDSVEFNAARILLLLYYAGGARAKRIEGRTKLAKLDFFVRYPTFLVEAARIKGVETTLRPIGRPESRMIRYKYGPWDTRYYNIFAYLVAKGLITIEGSKDLGDVFKLTDKGKVAVGELNGPEFDEVIQRCQLVYKLFGSVRGTTIKNFIYEHFTDLVEKPMGAEIEEDDA